MKERFFDGTFTGFRSVARQALQAQEAPHEVAFVSHAERQQGLFAGVAPSVAPVAVMREAPDHAPASPGPGEARLPRRFLAQAEYVCALDDRRRFALVYRLAWRLHHGEPQLLHLASDTDVVLFTQLHRAAVREVHKCHAFVRFRKVAAPAVSNSPVGASTCAVANEAEAKATFVAWYVCSAAILALSVPHFVERFGPMQWSILTPQASVYCVGGKVCFGPGAARHEAPKDDALEDLWRTYYASIFNPARLNMRATRNEMPQRFWQNLPEARLIAPLQRDAPRRAQAFLDAQKQVNVAQESYPNLGQLQRDLSGCKLCPWSAQTNGAVGGEGPSTAALILVGEQPGDAEDVQQKPFVGPAGQLLNQALAEAGVARDQIYLTNAVKHFKFKASATRRLHQKPNPADVAACRGWLMAEMKLLRPRVLLCLGATAALAVRGQLTKIGAVRGQVLQTQACAQTLVTGHPSAILRAQPGQKGVLYANLVQDLRTALALAKQS